MALYIDRGTLVVVMKKTGLGDKPVPLAARAEKNSNSTSLCQASWTMNER